MTFYSQSCCTKHCALKQTSAMGDLRVDSSVDVPMLKLARLACDKEGRDRETQD